MSDIMDTVLVRNGTFGSVWLDNELMAEAKACQAKVSKEKTNVPRCRVVFEGHKMTGARITGSVRLYNATSRLLKLEGEAIKQGKDLRHTLISALDDPDNPHAQRIAFYGVSFDDLTLADWQVAVLGEIEAPFTAENYEILED